MDLPHHEINKIIPINLSNLSYSVRLNPITQYCASFWLATHLVHYHFSIKNFIHQADKILLNNGKIELTARIQDILLLRFALFGIGYCQQLIVMWLEFTQLTLSYQRRRKW